ncbi:MAG: sulfatase-like hydrolase/transferase [Pirellulaceae bacterium]
MNASRLWRKSSWWLVLLGSLLPVATSWAAETRPNVIVILADDLGYGDLRSYGAKDMQTPHVDQLVGRGMRFENFYANCPVCSPTRAALLSGRYQELVGVPGVIRTHPENSWGQLARDAVLLPQIMQKAGYTSAIIGKWHLGLKKPDRPTDRGFEFFHGFLGDMMDDYYLHRRHNINYMRRGEQEIDPEGHATDLFSDWACDYLKSRRNQEQPFFLYLAYNAPHTPIQPPRDWVERVQQRHPQIDPGRAKLVALIEHMDDGIGKVMKTLEETGLANNTLVVFTSDNGGQLSVQANNGNLRDGKQSMYEGGLKVPGCVVWPNRIKAGSQTGRLVMTMDLYPTLCEAAGIKIDHLIEGVSFLPTLLGKTPAAEKRDLFFQRREGGDRYGGLTIQAIRRGEWKLLQNSPFEPLELYNLQRDPQEKVNLAGKERKVFRELSRALRVQVQRGGAVPWQPVDRRDVR